MLNFKSTQEDINCKNNGYYFSRPTSKDTKRATGGRAQQSMHPSTAGLSMSSESLKRLNLGQLPKTTDLREGPLEYSTRHSFNNEHLRHALKILFSIIFPKNKLFTSKINVKYILTSLSIKIQE